MKNKKSILLIGICTLGILFGCTSTEEDNSEHVVSTIDSIDSVDGISIPDYSNIIIENVELEEVTEDEIEAYIESMLSSYLVSEEVTDRAIESGDTVNIDYVGMIDGEPYDGGSAEGYDLTVGSGTFVSDFEDGLIGASKGDTVEIEIEFSEEYTVDILAGEVVTFFVTVNYFTEQVVSDLTDEYIQEISDTSTTIEEYEEEVLVILEEEKLDEQEEMIKYLIWEALVYNATVEEYDEEQMEYYMQELDESYEMQASYYGLTLEEFIEASGMTTEEYEEFVLTGAQEIYISRVIVTYIGEKEGITPTEEEYQAEIEELATTYGYLDADSLCQVVDEEDLKFDILTEVVVTWLMDKVTYK